MLESVRVETKGVRQMKARQSAGAVLRYKNTQTCKLLLNAVRLNASDQCKPKKIRLPTFRSLIEAITGSRHGRWMAKIDLTNCCWSIRQAQSWRKIFMVREGERGAL